MPIVRAFDAARVFVGVRASPTRLALVVVVAVLAVPYGVLGPGYFREDWISLANARSDGYVGAAGALVATTRPGAALVYAVTFGVLEGQYFLAWLLLVALHAVAVVLVYEVARVEVGPRRAAVVALLWTLLPTHASLTHWISVTHISVALILALLGVLAARRATSGDASRWPPALLIFGSALFYEALLPPVLLALVFVAASNGNWMAVRPALLAGAAAVVWSFTIGYLITEKAPAVWVELKHVIGANLGWGLSSFAGWGVLQAALLAWIAAATVMVVLPGSRNRTGTSEQMVVAGLLIAGTGLAPFVPFGADIDFVGLGDRANVVSSLGVACVLVGLGERLRITIRSRRVRLSASGVMVLSVLVVVLPTRIEQDREWAAVASWQRVVSGEAALAHRKGRPSVRIGYDAVGTAGIEGLNNEWDASSALRWWTHDAGADVECRRAPGEVVDVEVDALRPTSLAPA